MARDEARHAGFLNKSMNDFGLQLDLGFLTATKIILILLQEQFFMLPTYLKKLDIGDI